MTHVISRPRIGIAWRSNDQEDVYRSKYFPIIEAAGGSPVILKQCTADFVEYDHDLTITNTCTDKNGILIQKYADMVKGIDFSHSNAVEITGNIDAVLFLGGEDISPTLFSPPQSESSSKETMNATRDVSDYILMAYCLKMNIPLLGICRGEQILGIVSGCSYIRDIDDYFEYLNINYDQSHRPVDTTDKFAFSRHPIDIPDPDTHMYRIVGGNRMDNTASWHHQAVGDKPVPNIKFSAEYSTNGVSIVEAIERTDVDFALGVQFHPEWDIYLEALGKEPLSDPAFCLRFFKALVESTVSSTK